MNKQQQLDKIAGSIIEAGVCPELAATATQLVFGVGSPDAEIVFIGEAPGKKEDEQGEPFVGAAGKFLNEMLDSIGLERKDIYITNIVKYRPPENRDPLPKEKAAFLPFLLRQLEAIDPKLIVTLGRHSMEYFLSGKKISQIHGEPKRIRVVAGRRQQAAGEEKVRSTEKTTNSEPRVPDSELRTSNFEQAGRSGADAMQGDDEQRTEAYKEYAEGAAESATQQSAASNSGIAGSAREQTVTTWTILPLYHPAAALYNGGQRQTLLDDFAKIPKILELADRDNQAKTKEQEAK